MNLSIPLVFYPSTLLQAGMIRPQVLNKIGLEVEHVGHVLI